MRRSFREQKDKINLRFDAKLSRALFATLILVSCIIKFAAPANAETWEDLDKRLKQQVYQLNVGLKLRVKNGSWLYLSDKSPKNLYPIYSTAAEDRPYLVVGFGTCFPVRAALKDKTYLLTSGHVVQSAEPITIECTRFYAAMHLYAEQTGDGNADGRFKQVQQIVDLRNKINARNKTDMTPAERTLYLSTCDAIWDTYDKYLSQKADPQRALFNKYSKMTEIQSDIGYFIHTPGPVTQPALQAKLYKVPRPESGADIAILSLADSRIEPIDIETITASEGQEVQVIGYPTASDQIDADSDRFYAPTFSTGRISRVTPHILQFDAPITSGNSGGPVVSAHGKVVGVVAVRALSSRGGELSNFGGAVTLQSIRQVAPELFGN